MDDGSIGLRANPLGIALIALGFVLGFAFSQTTDICTTRYAPELLVAAVASFVGGFALCLPRRPRRIVLIALAIVAIPGLVAAIALTAAVDGWC